MIFWSKFTCVYWLSYIELYNCGHSKKHTWYAWNEAWLYKYKLNKNQFLPYILINSNKLLWSFFIQSQFNLVPLKRMKFRDEDYFLTDDLPWSRKWTQVLISFWIFYGQLIFSMLIVISPQSMRLCTYLARPESTTNWACLAVHGVRIN